MGYVFVALTILLSVYGQFVVKWQVLKVGSLPGNLAEGTQFLFSMLLNPWIVSGLAAAVAASLCWMLALTKLPLSEAYPFTAAQFIIVVVGGAWLFSEPLSAARIIGVILIGIGVVVSGL